MKGNGKMGLGMDKVLRCGLMGVNILDNGNLDFS